MAYVQDTHQIALNLPTVGDWAGLQGQHLECKSMLAQTFWYPILKEETKENEHSVDVQTVVLNGGVQCMPPY
jgi:hypothetical protein